MTRLFLFPRIAACSLGGKRFVAKFVFFNYFLKPTETEGLWLETATMETAESPSQKGLFGSAKVADAEESLSTTTTENWSARNAVPPTREGRLTTDSPSNGPIEGVPAVRERGNSIFKI